MTLTAFLLIFASATLHATWNMIAKKNRMTYPFYGLLCSAGVICFGHILLWTPVQFSALPSCFLKVRITWISEQPVHVREQGC